MKPFQLALVPCLAALPAASLAADFCVTNGAQLRTILDLAAANGEPDRIRLAVGSYVHPEGESFRFRPIIDGSDFEISGGWVSGILGPCTRQASSRTAFDTVIDAGLSGKALDIEPRMGSSMDVSVSWIAFTRGNGTSNGHGLRIYSEASASSTITVEHCAFVKNIGAVAAAVWIRSPGTTHFRNSLIEGNITMFDSVALVEARGLGSAYVSNVTVVNNRTSALTADGAGLHAWARNGGRVLLANNHLWDNEGFDLVLLALDGSTVIASNNNARSMDERPYDTGVVVVVGAMSAETVYEPGSDGSFVPVHGSPLIDAGVDPAATVVEGMPWVQDWSLGNADLLNTLRVKGGAVDIGAFEARPAGVFLDGFE